MCLVRTKPRRTSTAICTRAFGDDKDLVIEVRLARQRLEPPEIVTKPEPADSLDDHVTHQDIYTAPTELIQQITADHEGEAAHG